MLDIDDIESIKVDEIEIQILTISLEDQAFIKSKNYVVENDENKDEASLITEKTEVTKFNNFLFEVIENQ